MEAGLPSGACTLVVDSARRFVEIEDVQPLASGGFAVVEGYPPHLVLLDEQGGWLRSSKEGRLGKALLRVLEGGDGRLMVPDSAHDRLDIYDAQTLDSVGTIPLGLDHHMAFGWTTDGLGRPYYMTPESPLRSLLTGFRKPGVQIRRIDGSVARHLFSVPVAPGSEQVFGPRFSWCVLTDGTVAISNGVSEKVDYYLDGTLVRSVPAPGVGEPISSADREAIVGVIEAEAMRVADDLSPFVAALIRSEAKPEAIADVYPAFTRMVCDEAARIWFRLPAVAGELHGQPARTAFRMVDNGSSRWIVQEPAGIPRWTVAFPTGFTLTRVKDGVAAGHMRAADHARVQAYRITPP